jgi:hypothetical protein
MTRVFKVFKFLSSEFMFSDLFNFNSGIVSLLQTFCQVLFAVHIMGCLWYLAAVLTATDEVWVSRYGFQGGVLLFIYFLYDFYV